MCVFFPPYFQLDVSCVLIQHLSQVFPSVHCSKYPLEVVFKPFRYLFCKLVSFSFLQSVLVVAVKKHHFPHIASHSKFSHIPLLFYHIIWLNFGVTQCYYCSLW